MFLLFYLYSICYLILPQKGKLSHGASMHRVANQHRLFDGEIVERVPEGLSLQHSIYMNLPGKNCPMENKSWVITESFEISNIVKFFSMLPWAHIWKISHRYHLWDIQKDMSPFQMPFHTPPIYTVLYHCNFPDAK